MRVKITKLGATVNPVCITPEAATYRYGQDNGDVSLPNDYYLVGVLKAPIEVGQPVTIDRESRNGVACPGIMRTTTVLSWDGKMFTTQNSVYKVENVCPQCDGSGVDSVGEEANECGKCDGKGLV